MTLGNFSLRAVMALAASTVAFSAQAETYPTREITMVVIGPPGGATDQAARLVANRMSERLGKPVVVNNKPGAGGNIASEYVARSNPDGYTIMLGTQGTHAFNQYLYKDLRFDPAKDFVPVRGVLSLPSVLVANPSTPYTSVKELVDYAKKNPNKIASASAGMGTGTHLALALFNKVAGTETMHVPYKGSSFVITDLVGGRVDFAFDYPVGALQLIHSGKLRALAVAGANRFPLLPDVPTLAESGYPEAEFTTWFGLFFPANTPAPIVDRWRTELDSIVQEPSYAEAALRIGGEPFQSGGEFAAYVKAERIKARELVLSTGAKVE
ncbi:ABC transporter substrate-binding protein [Pollutimonas nitritireducens]|uniref:ABC transporter substrate-binding protein n=1 Tax=Pollutimonas nitritireducens TaxID=2045209 RepID=A0A2N4UG38_9BURK|nr:tripartite tricarboxylate transporter substrate binding protein [Pollutimonas nitritireducens]PLC53976.1 ABC transporter substrate-binding protein [Pollutimonas nitritireducens]